MCHSKVPGDRASEKGGGELKEGDGPAVCELVGVLTFRPGRRRSTLLAP